MNFEIPKLAWIKAVMMAAAKKDVRYYLNGVMVRNGEVAATNGHMALIKKGIYSLHSNLQISEIADEEMYASLQSCKRVKTLKAKGWKA